LVLLKSYLIYRKTDVNPKMSDSIVFVSESYIYVSDLHAYSHIHYLGLVSPQFLDRLVSESAKNDQRSSDIKEKAMKVKSPPRLAIFSIMPVAHAANGAYNKKIMVYRCGGEIPLCLPSEISNGKNQTAATDTAMEDSYLGAEYGAKIREEMRRLTSKMSPIPTKPRTTGSMPNGSQIVTSLPRFSYGLDPLSQGFPNQGRH